MMSLIVTSDQIVELSMVAFNRASGIINYFVILSALGRVAYLNGVGSRSDQYTGILKGVVLYFVLIYSFESILKLLVSFPEYFDPHSAENVSTQTKSTEATHPFVPNVLIYVLESAVAVLYYLAKILYFLLTITMSAMAPVVFLLGGILEIGLGIETFFSLLVMVSCWPIIFAACDAMTSFLTPETSGGLPGLCFELLIVFFKLIGPQAIARAALSSHAGQAIRSTLSTVNGVGGAGVSHAQAFNQGYAGQPLQHQPRSLTGHASHGASLASHGMARMLAKRRENTFGEGSSLRQTAPDRNLRPESARTLTPETSANNSSQKTRSSESE